MQPGGDARHVLAGDADLLGDVFLARHAVRVTAGMVAHVALLQPVQLLDDAPGGGVELLQHGARSEGILAPLTARICFSLDSWRSHFSQPYRCGIAVRGQRAELLETARPALILLERSSIRRRRMLGKKPNSRVRTGVAIAALARSW